MRPGKTQISLRIRAVCSGSLQGTPWVAQDPKRIQVDRENSEQTARIREMISVFAGRKYNLVGNAQSEL